MGDTLFSRAYLTFEKKKKAILVLLAAATGLAVDAKPFLPFVNYLDKLLARGNAFQYIPAGSALFNPVNEIFNHSKVDIRFQEI